MQTNLWQVLLPSEYRDRVTSPVSFERHVEPSVHAEKILGFDVRGERCFYYHAFLLTEEGFDADEFPIMIDVYYERVIAWRLRQGLWVRIKSYSDRMGQCGKPLTTLPAELSDTEPH